MARLIRSLWRVAAGLFAAIVILAALLVGLARLALEQVPEYREQAEAWAGEALGWPVEIGAMDARFGWHGPELRFEETRVLTRERDRTLVTAAAGAVRLDTWALLRGQLRPGAVSLSGVHLRLERNREGRWRLLGEEGPALGDGASPAERGPLPRLADLPTTRVRLEAVEVEVEDLRRELGPWLIRVDELGLGLAGGELELELSGQLPEELGGGLALSFRVESQDERGRPRDWSAGMSFSGLRLGAVGMATGRPDRWPDGGLLYGKITATNDAHGLARVSAELQGSDLALPAQTGDPEFSAAHYARLETEIHWQRKPDGWALSLSELDIEGAGERWGSKEVFLAFEQDDTARRFEARADRLWLDDLVPVARWLPAETRSRVAQLAPAGTLQALEIHVDLPREEERAPDIHVSGEFRALSVAAGDGIPGLSNLTGRVSGDSYGGSGLLASADAVVALPWLFREPLEFDSLDGRVTWRRDESGLRVEVPELALLNPDARVTASAKLELPGGEASPQLEIEATAREVLLEAGPRYLPVGIMPDGVVDWLDTALRGGRVDEAGFVFSGPTRSFPFRDDEGLFKVEFDIAEGLLAFAPGWPDATGLDAQVRFENEGLWAEVRGAKLLEVDAGPVSVAIPDLAQGLLVLDGEARGSLAALREFALAADLLEDLIGPGLAPAEMLAGEGRAHVGLELPLTDLAESQARVDLDISGGAVAYGFLGEPLREIDGRISIDNARVTAEGIKASLADRPLLADVVVTDAGAVRVEGRGSMDATGLARVLELPLDTWGAGEADWVGSLEFPAPGTAAPLEFEFSSALEGIAINLPAPFGKAAEASRALAVRISFPPGDLMDVELLWDDSLRIAARVDRSGPEPVYVAVPRGLEDERPGLVLSGAIARLDLEEWFDVEVPGDIEPEGLLDSLAGGRLLIGELRGPALKLDDLLLELERGEDAWRFDLSAAGVAGRATVPFVLYGDRPLELRLERLWLGSEEVEDVADVVDPEEPGETWRMHPARVPPLDVEIEDLRFGTIRFGRVSARVLHEGDGFELIGLEATGDDFIFQARGRSRLSDSVDESELSVRLQSEHVGRTLDYLGYRRSMEARAGHFEGKVRWTGGLRGDWLEAIRGEAEVSIRDGTLLGVDPGAGRVFGLLSIQALPRRLALDFTDVFGEGTAFDRISGDFQFRDGSAFTENLLLRGPAADIVVVGRTGLVARDYDQTAVIAADLGRTLPVAGVVVGGPAVGAALYLLSEILRKPFQTQLTYRLTGPWDKPVIERVGAATIRPAEESPAPEPEDRP